LWLQPRKEAAVLNARIRKRWRTGQLKIGVIGAKPELTYGYDHLAPAPIRCSISPPQAFVRGRAEGRQTSDRAGRRQCDGPA